MHVETETFPPGSTIGILGGGQLGRMFTIAAKQMGYRVIVYSPDVDAPAAQVADQHVVARYKDPDALRSFAAVVDVATLEFEDIPTYTLLTLGRFIPVRPDAETLRRIDNRISEKGFLSSHGFPVAPYMPICHRGDFAGAAGHRFPAILKASKSGYDGKGQQCIDSYRELDGAWKELGEAACVLETQLEFELEFSVLAARNSWGAVQYAPIRNEHRNHILDVSSSPARLPSSVSQQAQIMVQEIAEALGYVGVLCVEFFLLDGGAIVVNEIAPRPHNSGHLTIEAHHTSQFEQQVRAVCGLPLGTTAQRRPAAMANLLGSHCGDRPNWHQVLSSSNSRLHLYGKSASEPARKMGHITSVRESVQQAIREVREGRAGIASRARPERKPLLDSHGR